MERTKIVIFVASLVLWVPFYAFSLFLDKAVLTILDAGVLTSKGLQLLVLLWVIAGFLFYVIRTAIEFAGAMTKVNNDDPID